ncbi:MAG: hypothetical protein JXA20_09135, partial [Spirochaetes bacterium]|nr:hypothetical protein [Spirochaetota bacterium]
MKVSYLILAIALSSSLSCREERDPLGGIDFGISPPQVRESVASRGIVLEKCSGWYPHIDTYFCFIEKYGFPHVTAMLEFYRDRLYRVRYLLDERDDPLGTYTLVLDRLRGIHGEPAESRIRIPPGFS